MSPFSRNTIIQVGAFQLGVALFVAIDIVQAFEGKMMTIDYRDIPARVKIIGKLRHPLGDLVTIHGRWINVIRDKPVGIVFSVESVDGKPLNPPAEFTAADVNPVLDQKDADRPKVGEGWDLRGVETGGFVGFSEAVLREARGIGPPSSPAPSGFLTNFRWIAKRISN